MPFPRHVVNADAPVPLTSSSGTERTEIKVTSSAASEQRKLELKR